MKLLGRSTACVILTLALLSGPAASQTGPAATCFGLAPTIVGTNGNDQLVGGDGPDVILARGGDDQLFGMGGNDALCGEQGNDAFVPGPGDDQVDGGGGGLGIGFIDLVLYDLSPAPVRVDLAAGTATGEGSDRVVNVSVVSGTRFNDTLLGDAQFNIFYPESGNDVVDGRAGDDTVGFGRAVTADLATQSATGDGSDSFTSVEGLSGSRFRDVLLGDARGNYLSGGLGNDVIDGRAGDDRAFGDEGEDRVAGGSGNDRVGGDEDKDQVFGGPGDDTVQGGAGTDTIAGDAGLDIVDFAASESGVQVNLLVGRAVGEGLDTLKAVEDVDGSLERDQLLGNSGTNFLYGNAGGDRIAGGLEADFLDGGAPAGALVGGPGRDYCLTGAGAARCEIFGVPGRLPPVPDRPPQRRISPSAGVGSTGPGMAMPLPSGWSSTAMRTRLEDVFRTHGGGDPRVLSPVELFFDAPPSLGTWLTAPKPGTGAFRYERQPTCRPGPTNRTTIAAPNRVEPARANGEREDVYWRGILFRRDAGSQKLVRLRETPWLVGTVQGPAIQTGFPSWFFDDRTRKAPRSFSFPVPNGEYVWVGLLTWREGGGRVNDFIEPHVQYGGGRGPDKSCVFGSRR